MKNKSGNVDLDFTKSLPKAELHAHLSGSITRSCLHEIWLQKKARNPELLIEDPLISMPLGKVNYDLNIFFKVFPNCIYQLCGDLESLTYATKSVLQDFQKDGVRYLELRTTPRVNEELGISKEKYVETVLDSIHDFKNDQMSVYLILSIDRSNTSTQALEVVDLAIKHKPRGIVGLDLCGNPTKGDVSIFEEAFAKAKDNGLKVTLHFAETTHSSSLKELNTLMSYRPDRLGHVIHVPGEVKDEIAHRRLGLELCLSCNVHAQLTSGGFSDHHFGYWRNQDCPISLGTDDVGFFCSPLSNEYLLAAQHFNLDRSMVLDLCKRGIDAIFGGQEEKDRLRKLLSEFEEEMA